MMAGDRIRLTVAGEEHEAFVAIVSANGRSLGVTLDHLVQIGETLTAMALLFLTHEGTWVELVTGSIVGVEERPPMRSS